MTQSKLVGLDAALASIGDGAKVALGGWIFNSQPMALVRGLIRKGVRDLELIPAPSSIAPDLLIGAGCVRSTTCTFISFEQFGLAPNFRRAAETGSVQVIDIDGPAMAAGLRASICDMPWMPIPDLATDLPKHAPQIYRSLPAVAGERKMLAVAAIEPDVCLLHAQQADIHGNVQFLGPPFFDVMLAQASRRVIVSVDRIVSTDTIRRHNHLTKLPAAMVDAVVEAPWGAHPTASPTVHRADDRHLIDYVKASADPTRWEAYQKRFLVAQNAYLDEIGGARLAALRVSESTAS